ncbi:MAG: DUF805 domain-containing protein [Thiovulaceae bacterium]|nr:DUF805 domain-containing protein [Sulfurimonadaceae bacterium]
MTGTIVSYDKSFDDGLIKAEDGHSYHFGKSDFVKRTSIHPHLEVNFIPDNAGFATQIKTLNRTSASLLFSTAGCISQRYYLALILISITIQTLFGSVLFAFIVEDLSLNTFIDNHFNQNQTVDEFSILFSMMKGVFDAGILFFVFIILLSFNFLLILIASIKRLHDMNLSGFWVLITFLPFGMLLMLAMCLLTPSIHLNNRFCKG